MKQLFLIFMIAINSCLSENKNMTSNDCRNKCFPDSAIYHNDKEKKIIMCYCLSPGETK